MVALPILPAPQLLQTPHPPQPPAPQIPPGGRCSWWRCRFFRRCSSCVHRCPFGARILELLQVPQTLLLPPILPAPPPAGGSIDRIASAVGRSVLFVRIFGGDHPFPFLSFPFLSFPFLSFPFPRSCLRTFIGARSVALLVRITFPTPLHFRPCAENGCFDRP